MQAQKTKKLHLGLTTCGVRLMQSCVMSNVTKIHNSKTPMRTHYIVEWADRMSVRQVDLVKATGADKSTVSRWFQGQMPGIEYLPTIAAALGREDIASLFRDPDDDWMAEMFRKKQLEKEDQKRAIAILDAAFPDKAM
jgi:transcriptional regulator with XRE-family HTH domain